MKCLLIIILFGILIDCRSQHPEQLFFNNYWQTSDKSNYIFYEHDSTVIFSLCLGTKGSRCSYARDEAIFYSKNDTLLLERKFSLKKNNLDIIVLADSCSPSSTNISFICHEDLDLDVKIFDVDHIVIDSISIQPYEHIRIKDSYDKHVISFNTRQSSVDPLCIKISNLYGKTINVLYNPSVNNNVKDLKFLIISATDTSFSLIGPYSNNISSKKKYPLREFISIFRKKGLPYLYTQPDVKTFYKTDFRLPYLFSE